MSYNRYSKLMKDGEYKYLPFIKLPQKISDKEDTYVAGSTRFDLLSEKYYNDANYGWLILLANPNLPSLEYKIQNNTAIKIPYPLDETLNDYKNEIDKHIKYYGL